ncbi:cryptochrome/photolyase family protein [Verrucomicrobia bacterium LW23]|nr:cryptochrome/photolyase family protein [Verrucomicrobia bacterium LW23]
MRVVWILGDQLHVDHPALHRADRNHDRVLFIESRQRSQQVRYHQQKLVLIFSAMRHRAEALRAEGWKVDYVELTGRFSDALVDYIRQYRPDSVLVQEPSQFAFRQALPRLSRKLGVPVEILPTNQFLVAEKDFKAWAGQSRHLLMENHYRRVRKKLGILIEPDGKPTGGAWNFDSSNRETYAAFRKRGPKLPQPPRSDPDHVTRQVIALVKREFPDHPGDAADFWLPVTREESLRWLHDFIANRLNHFGPWEDMMVADEPVLFHSVLTPMLNIGLLSPRECVEAAVSAYKAGGAPLTSVEGFVRQIIGWREFINGVYWLRMPGYEELNELQAVRPLPSWVYTGETELNCLRHVLRQVIATGYNHHIQRLMVLGNFFLLGGFAPDAVLRWYTEMYVDAHDWVMAANVIGMVLHADGGFMATKPYAAGAGYIHKMSNYCGGCRYRPDQRTGPDACPFNFLYWNFYATHRERFATNPRVGMMIKTWDEKPSAEKAAILQQAKDFLESGSSDH